MAARSSTRGHCPQCGAERQLYDSRCWLCGWLPAAAEAAISASVQPAHAAAPHERRPYQFSISSVLVFTAVIAVCLGAFRVAPGLGILLAVVAMASAVPAAIRNSAASARDPEGDSFWASFAVSAAAITVGIIACALSAFTAVMLACGVRPPSDPATRKLMGVLVMTLLFGSPIIGLVVAGISLWLTWPTRK